MAGFAFFKEKLKDGANSLTRYSNYSVRWGRAIEFFRPVASREQLIQRAYVAAMIASGAIFMDLVSDHEEQDLSARVALSLMGGFAGFFAGHVAVVYPAYRKRKDIETRCDFLVCDIEDILRESQLNASNLKKLSSIVDQAKNIIEVDPTTGHERATATWLARETALLEILENLTVKDIEDLVVPRGESRVRHKSVVGCAL